MKEIMGIFLLLVCIAVLMFAAVGVRSFYTYVFATPGHDLGWADGYVAGQIDALNGKVKVEKRSILHIPSPPAVPWESVEYVTTQPVK